MQEYFDYVQMPVLRFPLQNFSLGIQTVSLNLHLGTDTSIEIAVLFRILGGFLQ